MTKDGSDALGAIAEPRRRAILQLVTREELPAGVIAEHFEVTRGAVSQHLTVLKDVGLVLERREGTRRLYRADPEALAKLSADLQTMRSNALDLGRKLTDGAGERSAAG